MWAMTTTWKLFTSTRLADFIQALAVLHAAHVAYPDLSHDMGRAGAVFWGRRGRQGRGRGRRAGTGGWGGVVLWRLESGWAGERTEEKLNQCLLIHKDEKRFLSFFKLKSKRRVSLKGSSSSDSSTTFTCSSDKVHCICWLLPWCSALSPLHIIWYMCK